MNKALILLLLSLMAAPHALADEESAGHKTEKGFRKGAEVVGHGLQKGVDATSRGLKKGATATAKGLDKAARWIRKKTSKNDAK